MNRRAFLVAPLALAAVPAAAIAATSENVQPHSKLKEWRHMRSAMGRDAPLSDVRLAAIEHFGGPHAVMNFTTSLGTTWRVEVCGVAEYAYYGVDVVTLINGRGTGELVRFTAPLAPTD